MNDLFFIRYQPKLMLVDSMDMPNDVELAHRRLCDFVWAMDRSPQDDDIVLPSICRVRPGEWVRVKGGLQLKGWHSHEGFFEHNGALKTLKEAKDDYLSRQERTKAATEARLARIAERDDKRDEKRDDARDVNRGEMQLQSQSQSQSQLQSQAHNKTRRSAPDISEATRIYGEYPRKVGRPAALRAIQKQIGKFGFERLLDLTKRFASAWAVAVDLKFCPHPSTWFNQERFNDDPGSWCPETSKGRGGPSVADKLFDKSIRSAERDL